MQGERGFVGARTSRHVAQVVRAGVVQVGRAVGEVEAAVEDVEGHVTEGQQLEEQHHEEDDAQAQEGGRRAGRQVEECQACGAG
jgi:hypothetical protein